MWEWITQQVVRAIESKDSHVTIHILLLTTHIPGGRFTPALSLLAAIFHIYSLCISKQTQSHYYDIRLLSHDEHLIFPAALEERT